MKTMSKKSKKQYVEHYEEHVGEDVTPFVSFWSEENQVKTEAEQQNANAPATQALAPGGAKKKVRFWRRLTAIFS